MVQVKFMYLAGIQQIVQEKGALMDMHRVGIGRRVGVQPPFGHPDLRIEMVMG